MYSFFFVSRERTEFFELATHDGLTGLYLIRYFRQLLNGASSEAIENKQDLSLILMDIDNFKKCNDTYGHQMGDEVLKAVAKIVGSCQKALSSEDKDAECVTARYGGEEMIVMVKRSDGTDTALKVGEWIRQQVENTSVTFEGKTILVTLSLGVSKLFAGETVPDTMIRRADEALYQSKKSGKNRVTIWSAGNFAE
jgi:diguanylate cyclase (GGDEF)-like protein